MAAGITKSTDCAVFGESSMRIEAASAAIATDFSKSNYIDISGLKNICLSAYVRMFARTAGSFECWVVSYDDEKTQLNIRAWTILTQSGETAFTRYFQSYDLTALGDPGQLPAGTRYVKLAFAWEGASATGVAYVDGVKAEPGTLPTAWTPYQLKEQDSLDLVADGEVYRKVAGVSLGGKITGESINNEAIQARHIEVYSIGSEQIAEGAVNLGYQTNSVLPNSKLGTIMDAGKIQDGLLAETKLDTDAQGKLAALRTDGKVKGSLVKATDGSTLIDTGTGRLTANLKTTTDVVLDTAINDAASLHSRAIAEPYEETGVAVGAIHDAGGGVFTYRLGYQAAGAAINIGETGDSLSGLVGLLDSAGGDLLDGNGLPVTVTGLCTGPDGTGPLTPGDVQPFGGMGEGWWYNDGGGVADSTVHVKLSALPAGTVTHFDVLYAKRNTIGNLGRSALVKKAVVSGETDPNLTNTIQDLKGTGDWNTPVGTGRKLIDLTDSNGKIASAKVIEASIADDAVTQGKLGAAAVGSTQLADQAVVGSKIATGSVTDAKLAAGAVTTDKLDNLAVTNAKLDQLAVSTPKLADGAVSQAKIGANAVGAAQLASEQASLAKLTNNKLQSDPDGSIKLGSGVALKHAQDDSIVITATGQIGTAKVSEAAIQDGAVTSGKVGSGEIGTGHLADDAVTQAKIGDSAVGSSKLASGAVVSGKIGASAVGSSELAASSVSETKLGDGAVSAAKLATGAVTSDKLAAGAVTNTKLGDGSVTQTKIGAAAVGASQLADQAVQTAKLAIGAVATDRLADGAVSGSKIATGAVSSSKIAADAVATANIQAGAVDADRLAAGAVTKDKMAADVFSELATTNLVIGGSFEQGVW